MPNKMGQPQRSGSPAAAAKAWNCPCLRAFPVHDTASGKHHGIAFMTQNACVLMSPSRPRPPQCLHAHSNGSKFPQKQISPYSNSDSNFVDQGGAGCAWVQDQGPRPPTIPPSLGGLSTLAACVLISTYVPCTMCCAAILRLIIGTGQRIACSGTRAKRKTNNEGQGGNCPSSNETTDWPDRRTDDKTAALADEQDRPSELAVVIPRSHRLTSPCSHIHTHGRPLWRVRWRDVKNTTLGLLVPEHRQGSDPVPCMWKDEPG